MAALIAASSRGWSAAISYPFTADTWKITPTTAWVGREAGAISFARYEGMPAGTVTINDAIAESTDAGFSGGSIDFDIKPLAYSDTGIIFRRHGNDAGEIVYIRANPDCPAANDCIQYAPITHGLMQWDIYSNYEGPAPIAPTGWNHLHIVVAGNKMEVYVNREAAPSLVVPKLQGVTTEGGIAFKGPAIYANLVITPEEPFALRDVKPTLVDPGTIVNWQVAPPSALTVGQPVTAANIPAADVWSPITAEANGLVNLSRAQGAALAPSVAVGWLKTTINASTTMHRTMRLGWCRQVSVFLNGARVFSGSNPYYPTERRLSPNGRLEPDNASIGLDLREGANEIVLAVGNAWSTHSGVEKPGPYGWGSEAHLDDLNGLTLQ